MDIRSEVAKWISSDEQIKHSLVFGDRDEQILGYTNHRCFYYKKKGSKEDLIMCPGTFPMVERFSKAAASKILYIIGFLFTFTGLGTMVFYYMIFPFIFFFLGVIILIITYLRRKAVLFVSLGGRKFAIAPLKNKDAPKIEDFIRKLY